MALPWSPTADVTKEINMGTSRNCKMQPLLHMVTDEIQGLLSCNSVSEDNSRSVLVLI